MHVAAGSAHHQDRPGRGTVSPSPARWWASSPDARMIAGGLAVAGVGMLAVRHGTVSGVEESVFHAVNDLPGWLYPAVWPFQQLGALVLGPVVAIVALVLRRYRLAVAAVAVTVLKLVAERVVKLAVSRQRPGTSIGSEVALRGDVHLAGESFVSGHAVLVAGLAGVVSPYLRGRWKLVPWLLVAAVMVGRVYVGAHNPLDVICGAALGIAIAGFVNLVSGVRRRTRASVTTTSPAPSPGRGRSERAVGTHRLAAGAAVVVIAVTAGLTALVTGRSTGSSAAPVDPLTDDVITVGSFDFPESIALAEVYSQQLEAAGYTVERAFALGPREFVGPALADGMIELLPEYAGTAAQFHSLGSARPSADGSAMADQLARAVADRSMTVLEPAPGQDANTFVVVRSTARRLHLRTISDLAGVADQLSFGGPPECAMRRSCLGGLADVYDVRFADVLTLDAGGPATHEALRVGHIDVALLFTTDPLIEELDLVELIDDRGLQPAENIVPMVRAEIVDRWGDDVVDLIDGVSARLTTEEVRRLDRAVADQPGVDVSTVVASWWAEVGS